MDTSALSAGDYREAWGAALSRVHHTRIATRFGVREEGIGNAFPVSPLEMRLGLSRLDGRSAKSSIGNSGGG
jgi:hypothetical protein